MAAKRALSNEPDWSADECRGWLAAAARILLLAESVGRQSLVQLEHQALVFRFGWPGAANDRERARALALDGNRDLQTSLESGQSGGEGHSLVS